MHNLVVNCILLHRHSVITPFNFKHDRWEPRRASFLTFRNIVIYLSGEHDRSQNQVGQILKLFSTILPENHVYDFQRKLCKDRCCIMKETYRKIMPDGGSWVQHCEPLALVYVRTNNSAVAKLRSRRRSSLRIYEKFKQVQHFIFMMGMIEGQNHHQVS